MPAREPFADEPFTVYRPARRFGAASLDVITSGKETADATAKGATLGASVRVAGGKLDAIDGPFAESKEVVGGYASFDFKTRAEAIASAVEFTNLRKEYGEGWEGVCEMRQIAPSH